MKVIITDPIDMIEKQSALSAILTEGNFERIFKEMVKEGDLDSNIDFMNAHDLADSCRAIVDDHFINFIRQNYISEEEFDNFEKIVNMWNNCLFIVDNEFRKTVSKLDPNDVPIKTFPENVINGEKEILNRLAKNYYIKRELSDNGKFPLFDKKGAKRLIRALYEYAPDYKDFHAFNFINAFIETNLPPATLQNYCREVKKDMPINV